VDDLGKRLREHREANGITLEEIERVSNISLTYLRALEEGQYHTLPASTFTIGFLKQYARCVGLDPEEVVLQYRMVTERQTGSFQERSIEKSGWRQKRSIWILAGSLFFLFILWVALYPGPEMNGERVRAIRMPRTSLQEMKKEQLKKELGLGEVSRNEDSSREEDAGREGSAQGSGGQGKAPSQGGEIEVILQAIGETWVQINLDGESGYRRDLAPGDRHSCRAKDKVKLRIGNAGGLRIFYNGKVYENLGKKGDVVHISFPPSGGG
jgi:cytoskeletal protein RodZ